ncbi:sugar dehydrogenase complex small subunit [Ignatzschineria cameli]|uniref:sugar dehydrogenase complex small subunit n=1 Tax=Ignatzschineria cameli TaxID=2182793 RepID=UPI000D61C4A7|nr:sugar dehydrogenase complex small subunit [Ignatzschineria cameli]PWD85317.1 hypothetical protein DC080_06570 [Ignatzschineria cameli]
MNRADLSRRRFIYAGGLILSTALLPPLASAQTNSPAIEQHLDAFLQLSQKLTGYDTLNRELGARYLGAFLELFPDEAPNFAHDQGIQKKILHSWYTGTVGPNEAGQVRVIAYKDAFMYRPTADGLPTPTYCFRGELWFKALPPGITKEPDFPITF